MDIGKKIKELRHSKKISQQQLAKQIGTTAHLVGCWESEKSLPKSNQIAKLAIFFGVSSDYLLGLK